MNRLTSAYQVSALAKTRPIMAAISQAGVVSVTAVAKTLANSTMALGFVSVTRNPNSSGLP